MGEVSRTCLYSRFAFLAFFAVLAALGINNLSVFNISCAGSTPAASTILTRTG